MNVLKFFFVKVSLRVAVQSTDEFVEFVQVFRTLVWRTHIYNKYILIIHILCICV